MSVRIPADVPKPFRRDECGIDIVVLGFQASPTWEDHLTYSVLDNFWPAIELGDIEVRVGDREISKATLPGLLEKFSGMGTSRPTSTTRRSRTLRFCPSRSICGSWASARSTCSPALRRPCRRGSR